jgi:hypothetical protein
VHEMKCSISHVRPTLERVIYMSIRWIQFQYSLSCVRGSSQALLEYIVNSNANVSPNDTENRRIVTLITYSIVNPNGRGRSTQLAASNHQAKLTTSNEAAEGRSAPT